MNVCDGCPKSGQIIGIVLMLCKRAVVLPDTPGPVEDLSGAQHNERLRLVGNGAEQKAQILDVVRVQEDAARHLSMAQEAHLPQSAESASSNCLTAEEELQKFPQSEGAKTETPRH